MTADLGFVVDFLLMEFFAAYSAKRAYEHAWGLLVWDLICLVIFIRYTLKSYRDLENQAQRIAWQAIINDDLGW